MTKLRVKTFGIGSNYGDENNPDYRTEEIKGMFFNYQVNIGYDFPFLKFHNDKMAISANSNFAIGNIISPQYVGLDGSFSINMPEYLAFRYGKRASKNNKDKWGISIGAGYNFSIIPIPLYAPNAFADVAFGTWDKGKWFVKLSIDIKPSYLYHYYSSEGLVPAISFREIGIQIGFTL